MSVQTIDCRAALAAPPARFRAARPWGFWSTNAWVVLASLAVMLAVVFYFGLRGQAQAAFEGEGVLVQIANIALWSGITGVLMLLARLRGFTVRDYFAFGLPSLRETAIGLGVFAVFMAVSLAAYAAFGYGATDVKTQIDSMRQAQLAGALGLSLVYAVIVAPVTEEAIFRGFIYRGWAASRIGALGAILLPSALFGLLHVQYSWLGIVDCMLFGLMVGWLRWRSGSLWVPIMVHMANNIWASALVYYYMAAA